MWTSGFFNSINGDRLYNADQMSHIFEGLITDGVYESVANKLAVQPNSGMTIQIATGRGWFDKRWVNNDSEYTMTLEDSDVILNRYVAVVIKVDRNDSVRDAVPYLKYGEFATNPVKPTMTRTETVKEYCLAYIYQKAGAKAIDATVIEDTRGNNELCGWVTGLITQLNTTTLFAQWEALFTGFLNESTDNFNDWFLNLQDKINDNTEVMLVAALPTSLLVSLPASGWVAKSGGGYTQLYTVIGMNNTKTVIVSPDDETAIEYTNNGVKLLNQSANTLTFYANTIPKTAVKVNVVHMGV